MPRRSGPLVVRGSPTLGLGVALLFGAMVPGVPSAFSQALTNSDARLALHVVPATGRPACTGSDAAPTCAQIVTQGGLLPAHSYFVYLLVVKGEAAPGVSGLEAGIAYNGMPGAGVDVFGWTSCASLEFPQQGWPATGGGNRIGWDSLVRCQRTEPGGAGTGVVATAGYFYVGAYGPDLLRLTTHPGSGIAGVVDCAAVEAIVEGSTVHRDPSFLGSTRFSAEGGAGHNPCEAPAQAGCSLSGPATLVSGAENTYTIDAAPAGGSYAWSLDGPGLIVGASDQPNLRLRGTQAGTLLLRCRVTTGGAARECTLSLQAVPATGWFTGPSAGTVGVSVRFASGLVAEHYQWDIRGPVVVEGGTEGESVNLYWTAPGIYDVTLETASSDLVTRTTRSIRVDDCLVQGAERMQRGTVQVYAVAALAPPASYHWTVTGSGSIVGGDNDHEVTVAAGFEEAFDLSCAIQAGGQALACTRRVALISSGHLDDAAVLLHLLPLTTRGACTRVEATPPCAGVQTAGQVYPQLYFAYLLLHARITPGLVRGFSCGVQYEAAPNSGVDVFEWRLCADADAPTAGWPGSGGGNRIVWNAEHSQGLEPGGAGTGVMAAGGYFYLAAYTPDVMRVTAHPGSGRATLLDALGNELDIPATGPSPFGTLAFSASGTLQGYVPCVAAVPAGTTTWGSIKAMFGQQ